ncbi:hypothetical protein Csac_1432 [Caldicellulosiruptor saccharolyticus DSM 8903]|uniref:Uncharacterized protein n=1 Tax=Caldicellulosiruptor saccharolyticus (strain ATCC 43494 / DSM 8903 / Tp8T 6331) TaxID=351627 RepID=A4XJE8_CALS8|nr:hypothetical protein [Caldicellulosiruptor saccharolyticus]ABP67033.1 hypothetical protein Csac_1432 [Caldicellulosiruptor saccharolyticus DSM 8903]
MWKFIKAQKGDATLIFMISMMFLSVMLVAVAFFVILLSSETHHINDICQLAIEKTAYILATQGGDTSSDNENVLGDNLIVEERLREELSNLLSSHNMSLTAADISFNGKEVTITGTVNVQTKSPFGTSSEKTINFKYKGRFNKNYGM